MAHASVSSLVHTIDHILDSRQPIILYDSPQLQNFHAKLSSLLTLLETAPNSFDHSLSVKIRDKAYLAEDIIESMVYDYHSFFDSLLISCINLLSSLPFPGLFDWAMSLRHSSLWRYKSFDTLVNDFVDIINRSSNSMTSFSSSNNDVMDKRLRINVSFKDRKLIVGHKDEFERIRFRLVGSVPKSPQVIPISGMGGIGKTTLAMKLYNDLSVTARFDIRAWVTIKHEYDLREIVQKLVDILPKVNKQKEDNLEEENPADLTEQLYKALYGRRYLIVMDDVWDTNVWDYFQRFFPDNGNCSRVILTTRHEKVAVHAGVCTTPPHVMELLSADECWQLLRSEVFGNGYYCPIELVSAGKEIASSCKGLPLVVTVIAGLLSKGNNTLREWEDMAENLSSTVVSDTDVADILLLSYKHLPQHLKACFLYTGVFLEYYKTPVSRIVKLWAAEGFVKQIPGKTLEEVAEEYMLDLVERCLVSVGQKRSNGRIKTIIIHDLLRELCIREARKENFLHLRYYEVFC